MCRILLQLDTKIRLISTLFRTLAAQHSKYYRSTLYEERTLYLQRINDQQNVMPIYS